MKDNIILIGMSGAGKSTIGVLLAKALNMKFIDTDILLQTKHNQLLHEMIADHGREYFLNCEESIIRELKEESTVIATGGSVVYSSLAMEHLRAMGEVVYLKVNYKNIEKRLKDITSRGVVMEPGQSLKALFDERMPLYESYAKHTLCIEDEGVETTINRLIKLIA